MGRVKSIALRCICCVKYVNTLERSHLSRWKHYIYTTVRPCVASVLSVPWFLSIRPKELTAERPLSRDHREVSPSLSLSLSLPPSLPPRVPCAGLSSAKCCQRQPHRARLAASAAGGPAGRRRILRYSKALPSVSIRHTLSGAISVPSKAMITTAGASAWLCQAAML
jgi:hypothetical protein